MNFHLATNSPAGNAGATNFVTAPGEWDFDLQPRVALGRTDIGADELNILAATIGIAPLTNGQVRLQLSGEPGHPFVLEQSDALANWLAFLTNYSDETGAISITNPATATMQFFRARMTQ